MKKRSLKVSTFILFVTLFMSGCTGTKRTDNTYLLSELNEWIVEAVLENNEMGDTINASDIAIDQICYGSFSQPDAKEALVICKFLNIPHVGGSDRTACIILSVDSMEMVAYQEFGADEVLVYSLPMSKGQDRIFFSGTTTYQGVSAQDVLLFSIQSGQWVEVPIDALETLNDECFYFLADDVMIAASRHELTDLLEVIAILTWDSDTGQFVLEQFAGDSNSLSEQEIIGFNTGFFNSEADIMNNMLLSSEYDAPGEIDLFQLFYNGLGAMADQFSTKELTLLTELYSDAPYLDIVKVKADEMDAFLRERLGIGLEETQKTGLDNFYYLEEYDSYYLVVGDTNYEWCTVISGIWESDDRLRLNYIKENEEGRWSVTLQKVEKGYLFVSNVRAD